MVPCKCRPSLLLVKVAQTTKAVFADKKNVDSTKRFETDQILSRVDKN